MPMQGVNYFKSLLACMHMKLCNLQNVLLLVETLPMEFETMIVKLYTAFFGIVLVEVKFSTINDWTIVPGRAS